MKYFAANWKLNKSPKSTREFFTELKSKASPSSNNLLIVFPSAISLEAASTSLNGTSVQFGAQNCYLTGKGAFTGENSADVVKELGGQWVLIGHSERRALFKETDEMLAEKVSYVQSLGLVPMLCIGETLQERESSKTNLVLEAQLQKGLSKADRSKKLTVAYEPVWAIGTGKVATTAQVLEAHQHVRQVLNQLGFSNQTPILYGGSVKPDNAPELISLPNVDGFLIGGASLEVKSYLEIVNANAN